MNIECPSCSTENKIEYGENIVCSECKGTFAGHTYKKFKKPFISATTALVIGIYGGYKMDDLYFDDTRYPLAIEYSIIEACVATDTRPLAYRLYSSKLDVCLCSLEKTMDAFPYDEFKENQGKFLGIFKRNTDEC